jgi:hypothetical protein
MTGAGWKCDRNDESILGFKFPDGEKDWIRDYDKKSRRFVQFDGNRRVFLRNTIEEESKE